MLCRCFWFCLWLGSARQCDRVDDQLIKQSLIVSRCLQFVGFRLFQLPKQLKHVGHGQFLRIREGIFLLEPVLIKQLPVLPKGSEMRIQLLTIRSQYQTHYVLVKFLTIYQPLHRKSQQLVYIVFVDQIDRLEFLGDDLDEMLVRA
jgi:hypothetical protein